jgi:hypothetical protein
VIWIMVPLIAFVIFGLYVRREAERIRAEDVRPRIIVKLKLAGEGMATPDELHLRQALEADIENRRIGSIADSGSGDGWTYLNVAVADTEVAAAQLRDLLRERRMADGAAIEVMLPAVRPEMA